MARKRAAEATEAGNVPPPQDAAVTSKADAVRAALAEGVDQPEEGVAFIKARFGLDISRQMFSSYKTFEKKRAGKVRRRGGRRASGAAAPSPSRNGKGDVVAAVETIKKLVDELGVDQVKRLADIFG